VNGALTLLDASTSSAASVGGKAQRIPPFSAAGHTHRMPDYRCNRVSGGTFSQRRTCSTVGPTSPDLSLDRRSLGLHDSSSTSGGGGITPYGPSSTSAQRWRYL